jgi:CBS domain-containing protein
MLEAIQKVSEVMVRKVVTAKPNTGLTDVAKLMRKNRIGSVIVAKDKVPVGIITEGDFIRLISRGCDMKEASVHEFMNRNVVTCDPSVTVIDALMIMRAERIRHLPVVAGKKLVGVISIRDLIAATQFSSYYVI